MNNIFLVLFLSITLVACGQTQPKETTEWKTLSEEKFTLSYPPSWELDQSGQMGSSFILFSPVSDEQDKFRENVNLLIQDLKGYELTLDQYVAISLEQIKNLATDGNILLNERKNKDGKEYQKLVYTATQGIFKLKFEQYCWLIDNQPFILTFTTEEKEFDKYQQLGEKILDSFTLK
ncbi:MAG: PsbP-related protein [Bacteroidota bacterium]